MRKINTKFKSGAASFYIVAFSTLILMVIATSFAAVIISEVTRTSNDDLSQSAYDSALAGIEDAKLAFYSYQNCLLNDADGCESIINLMENPKLEEECEVVELILGRPGNIVESNVGNNMEQEYTCVTMDTTPPDYRAELSAKNMVKVMRAKFDGVDASDIKYVKISWFSNKDDKNLNWKNKSSFRSLSGSAPTPPTISLALVQTSKKFTLADFETSRNGQTDRGMVYLMPSNTSGGNDFGADVWTKSNNKAYQNTPYKVFCSDNPDAEFVCSATFALPEPVGGDRNNDTFMFVVGLPYGKPDTDFALEFFCGSGVCNPEIRQAAETGEVASGDAKQAFLKDVQIEVDSTGRANDLYRRVVTRLESMDDFALSIMGPLELLGDTGSVALEKNEPVTCEWNFGGTGNCDYGQEP